MEDHRCDESESFNFKSGETSDEHRRYTYGSFMAVAMALARFIAWAGNQWRKSRKQQTKPKALRRLTLDLDIENKTNLVALSQGQKDTYWYIIDITGRTPG